DDSRKYQDSAYLISVSARPRRESIHPRDARHHRPDGQHPSRPRDDRAATRSRARETEPPPLRQRPRAASSDDADPAPDGRRADATPTPPLHRGTAAAPSPQAQHRDTAQSTAAPASR